MSDKQMDMKGRNWMKTGLVVAAAVAGMWLLVEFSPCRRCGGSVPAVVADSAEVKSAAEAAVAAPVAALSAPVSAENLPTLLDFGAEKCRPCQMLAPILAELEKEYAGVMTVRFVDVWKSENAAEAKKWGIESIPVQIFLDKDGKELKRHVGFISKEDIMAEWKALGYDLNPAAGGK